MILPSLAAYARKWPSSPPENTTPGIAVTAADCAGLQLGLSPQPGCGVFQAMAPVSGFSANRPQPVFGSSSNGTPSIVGCAPRAPAGGGAIATSDSAT